MRDKPSLLPERWKYIQGQPPFALLSEAGTQIIQETGKSGRSPSFLLRLLLVALIPTCVTVADALSDWRVLNRGGGPLKDVDYQNGVFVATGDTVLTSTNETNWSLMTLYRTGVSDFGTPYSVPIQCGEVANLNGLFVLFGTCLIPSAGGDDHEGVFASSADGTNWNVRTAFQGSIHGSGWLRLIQTAGRLLAYGSFGRPSSESPMAMSTLDGMNWRDANLPGGTVPLFDANTDGPVTMVVGGKSRPLSFPFPESQILTSGDGQSWSMVFTTMALPFRRVAWGDGRYVVAGELGSIATSTDQQNWTLHKLPVPEAFFSNPISLVFGNGQFLVLFELINSSPFERRQQLFRSGDGAVWTEVIPPSSSFWRNVAFGGGWFVAAGEAGSLLTSRDGLNWQTRASGVTNTLNAVRFLDQRFVVVGNEGVVLSSASLAYPPLQLQIQLVGEGTPEPAIQFTVEGIPGTSGRLDASNSLGASAEWVPLENFELGAEPWVWVAPELPTTSPRFYRAVIEGGDNP